jgi:hypothetical protein
MGISALTFYAGVILNGIARQHKEDYELNLLRYHQIEELKKVLKK